MYIFWVHVQISYQNCLFYIKLCVSFGLSMKNMQNQYEIKSKTHCQTRRTKFEEKSEFRYVQWLSRSPGHLSSGCPGRQILVSRPGFHLFSQKLHLSLFINTILLSTESSILLRSFMNSKQNHMFYEFNI